MQQGIKPLRFLCGKLCAQYHSGTGTPTRGVAFFVFYYYSPGVRALLHMLLQVAGASCSAAQAKTDIVLSSFGSITFLLFIEGFLSSTNWSLSSRY